MIFKFYVKMDGETYGPYSVRELMNLGLLDDTLITEEGMNGEWHQASEFDFDELLRKEEGASSGTIFSRSSLQSSSSFPYFKWILILAAILLLVLGVAYIFNRPASNDRPIPISPTPKNNTAPSQNPPPATPSNETLVICPMCNGTGVFDFMPGDIVAPKTKCTGCNGIGKVDQATATEIMKVQQQLAPTRKPSGGTTNSGRDYSQCPDCYGNGKCSSCAGRGEKRYEGQYGQPDGIMDCPICHGTGRCQTCHGSGHI